MRERRRQVGVLRALGVQAAAVRAAFVIESAFVAVEGLVIGTVLALVTAWSITLTDAFGAGLTFRVPIVGISAVVVGTLICALLATCRRRRSASRIQPATVARSHGRTDWPTSAGGGYTSVAAATTCRMARYSMTS